MELNISGLKCDFCEYRDDDVQFSEYEASIGRPCPKCGNSLLTQEDFNHCIKLHKMIDRVDIVLNFLKWFNPMHYWRLIFGDKRSIYTTEINFKKENNYYE